MYGGLAVFIVYKHRGNMSRLIAGTERRFQIKPEASDKAKPEEDKPSDHSTTGQAKP
jgi:hypothetical protein